jgi:hypothetical protein
VLEEGASFLAARHTLASLPAEPKKLVTDFVNGGKSSFTAATLAANLEAALLEAVRARTDKLNTPRFAKIQPLFDATMGIADIGAAWSLPSAKIDAFVTLRCEVAHRGGQAKYVHFGALTTAVGVVSAFVVDTDNYLSDQLRTKVLPNQRPWNRK